MTRTNSSELKVKQWASLDYYYLDNYRRTRTKNKVSRNSCDGDRFPSYRLLSYKLLDWHIIRHVLSCNVSVFILSSAYDEVTCWVSLIEDHSLMHWEIWREFLPSYYVVLLRCIRYRTINHMSCGFSRRYVVRCIILPRQTFPRHKKVSRQLHHLLLSFG